MQVEMGWTVNDWKGIGGEEWDGTEEDRVSEGLGKVLGGYQATDREQGAAWDPGTTQPLFETLGKTLGRLPQTPSPKLRGPVPKNSDASAGP